MSLVAIGELKQPMFWSHGREPEVNLSNAKTEASHSLSNFFSTGEKIHNNMDIAVRRLVKEEYRSLPLAVCRGQAPSKCTWVKK